MRKITNKILFLVISLITLYLCGCENPTIYEEKTIIVNIESDVIPEVISSFGEGSLDETSMVYTHKIPYIKNLTLHFSKDGYKTEELFISTSEMEADTIEKTISFGKSLEAIIEVEVLGINSLDTLTVNNIDENFNLEVINKNTFNFRIPTRDNDYSLSFNLEGFKEFSYTFPKEDLVSGYAKIKLPAILEGQMYIGFYGSYYTYSIFDEKTDYMIADGDEYQTKSEYKFIIVPDDTCYYVELDVNGFLCTYDISNDKNHIIDISDHKQYYHISNILFSGDLDDYFTLLYFKDKNYYSTNHGLLSSLNNTIVLCYYENEFYYYENIKDKASSLGSDVIVDLSFSELTKVEFNVTTRDRLTNEVVEDYFQWYNNHENVRYVDGAFYVENYVMKPGYLLFDMIDQDGNVLYTYEDKIYYDEYGDLVAPYETSAYVSENFNGLIVDGQIDYNRKTYFYKDAITLDEITYNGEYYTCDPIVVDTTKNIVGVVVRDKEGYYYRLQYDPMGIVVLDEDMNVINPINVDGYVYLELEDNVEYSIKTSAKTFKIKPNEDEIKSGFVFTDNSNLEYVKVNIPTNTYAYINNPFMMTFYPDAEGNIYVPKMNSDLVIIVNYGFLEYSKHIEGSEVKLGQLVATNVNLGYIEDASYEFFDYIDGYYYYLIDNFDELEYIDSGLRYLENNAIFESNKYYRINKSSFTYDEATNIYRYNIDDDFDYVISFDDYMLESVRPSSAVFYSDFESHFYINEGETLTFDEKTYVISGYDSKYLYLYFDFWTLKFEEIEK